MKGSIAIFDSGLGGLTVLREIRQAFPTESLLYFGDTARVPYGEKCRETIIDYSREIGHFLASQQVKMIVIACNTASAYAAEVLRQEFAIPIVDVINPVVHLLAENVRLNHVAVLGTKATVRSGVYQERIRQKLPHSKVTMVPCSLFVPLVEEHYQEHPATKLIIEEYLSPLLDKGVDAVVLGCTHYPLLKKGIQEVIGDQITIMDSAKACADEIKKVMARHELFSPSGEKSFSKYLVSDDPEMFKKFGESFLGTPIDDVEKIEFQTMEPFPC